MPARRGNVQMTQYDGIGEALGNDWFGLRNQAVQPT